jgi:hypothetical protein
VNVVEPETLGPPIDAEPVPNAEIHWPSAATLGAPIEVLPDPEIGVGTKVPVPTTAAVPIEADAVPEIGAGTKAPVMLMVGAAMPRTMLPSDP